MSENMTSEMRKRVVVHGRERDDAIERIAMIPDIAGLTWFKRKVTGQHMMTIDTEKTFHSVAEAEQLAIALEVLTQIAREWEAESKE